MRLPSYHHGFESQANHLCFNQIIFECRKDENKQKEAGIGPFLKILNLMKLLVTICLQIIARLRKVSE